MSKSIKTLAAKYQNEAMRMLLAALGHDFSGSLSAQLDATRIEKTEDDNMYQDIYTHPLVDVRVVVEWYNG